MARQRSKTLNKKVSVDKSDRLSAGSPNSGDAPILSAHFYSRKTDRVAQDLIGMRLVRVVNGKRLSGIIVETEAYMGVSDAACHSYGGRQTTRNQSMYMAAGTAYVYFIYGMYF